MPDQISALLSEIELLDELATTGPWEADPDVTRDLIRSPSDDEVDLVATVTSPAINAELIALSRTALPALAQAVRGVLDVLDDHPAPRKEADPTG